VSGIRESELNVSGSTLYIDDLPEPPGLLHAVIVPSPTARGVLRGLDARQATALDPSLRVLTAQDIPGGNELGEGSPNEPLLVSGEWSYAGQPLALVLASSPLLARRAASLVRVEYEKLRPVLDAREAAKSNDFFIPPRTMASGDVQAAIARCALVVEGRVDSGGQEHVYLETQAALAQAIEGGRIRIVSGTQSPSGVQATVARILGLPMNAVEIEAPRLGGAFGGKEEQGALWAALAALGAYLLRKPVKIVLERREDMRWSGKRHPYSTDYRIGLDAEGRILAFEADYYQNAGALCDLSPAILSRTLFHAAGAYHIPNVRVTGRSCRTNLPPFTAFRGFGAPQAFFVIESAIDAAARKGGWDPAELRRRNLVSEGDCFHYGQIASDCRAAKCFDRLVELCRWTELRAEIESHNASNTIEKRGAALIPICFGISFTKLVMNQGGALVHVYRDGSVSVSTGAVEMGQQVARKLQLIASRTLGVSEDLVRVECTRTSTVANTYPTAASTGSDINGMAVLAACEEIGGRLLALAARILGVDAGGLRIEGGAVVRGCEPSALDWKTLVDRAHLERIDLSAHGFYATPGLVYDTKAEHGSPFAYHVYGCAALSATVDVLRGSYRFDEAWIVHDSGECIDRAVDLGQIEGAFAQGLGWAALEELLFDDQGSLVSDTLSTYKLPNLRFMPRRTTVEILESANPRAVMRSKAVGEPPLLYGIAGYFAVLDALRAAVDGATSTASETAGLGYDLPMTPEKVLDFLEGRRPC
jgi:xanthine dehydrogenase large subunit